MLSPALIFLNKTFPCLCPNLFLFGKGYGRLAYFTLGTSSKVTIVLNMCITALLDTQGNADWKGAPSLGKLAKRGSAEPKPVSPKSPFCASSHTIHCVYVWDLGQCEFSFYLEIVHGKQILSSLVLLLIVYNICTSMQNT